MFRAFAAVALLSLLSISGFAQTSVDITPDVVYGHKDGLAMTFDVFTPTKDANGAGVLFMVSGGWYSAWAPPEQMKAFAEPLTSKGYTVFMVRHGSSPRYGIPDAVADVRRAVRYIRSNAEKYKVDANRLGVYGMSAGGHLSLVLGTTGDDGIADGKDPLNKVSDRVQAVVAYVAPTDLTIMVKGHKDRLPAYANFPALNLDMEGAKTYSPLLHVSEDDAPTLLLAGAKDDLVPVSHSRNIEKAFGEKKVDVKIVEYPEAGHSIQGDDFKASLEQMVAWFDKHLAKK